MLAKYAVALVSLIVAYEDQELALWRRTPCQEESLMSFFEGIFVPEKNFNRLTWTYLQYLGRCVNELVGFDI